MTNLLVSNYKRSVGHYVHLGCNLEVEAVEHRRDLEVEAVEHRVGLV